jgi:hypothetical protein
MIVPTCPARFAAEPSADLSPGTDLGPVGDAMPATTVRRAGREYDPLFGQRNLPWLQPGWRPDDELPGGAAPRR